jgi:hypothetical protein
MNDVRAEYAYWYALPKRMRASLNLPATENDFAEYKGVTARTLRRWKSEPDFMPLVEQHRHDLTGGVKNSAISAVQAPRPRTDPRTQVKALAPVKLSDDPVYDPMLTPDEQKYLQVKDTLIQMAMDGNQGAMDLYLKHYGKTFVEAERQEFADYSGLSDEQLVSELCEMAGVEAVSGWLAERAAAGV